MAQQTYEECVAKKLELDKQLLDIENQVKKKEAEYNIWGGEDGEKYIQDMIQFYYKIIGVLIILIFVLVLFFIIYSEYLVYGTIASVLLVFILLTLYIYRPSKSN